MFCITEDLALKETVPGLVTVMGTVEVLVVVVNLEVKKVELQQITSHLSK